MKRIMLLLALASMNVLAAEETFLDIHLTSFHVKDGFTQNDGTKRTYNNNNFGIGFSRQITDSIDFRAGIVKNSHYRTSVAVGVQPFKYIFNKSSPGKYRVGLLLAVASGYDDENTKTGIPVGKVNLIALPNISIQVYKNNYINIGVLPGVVTTLTYQYRIQ